MLHAGEVGVRNVLIALGVLGQGAPVLGLGSDEGTVEDVCQACNTIKSGFVFYVLILLGEEPRPFSTAHIDD